ncbi:MAG: radical SAM protein [Terriglobales bacterium]
MTQHVIRDLPVVVLFPHNRCNCRCVMCDIWRIRQSREISPDDLRPHLDSFRELRVRSVVFSGGEAQLNRELKALALMLRAENIHVTLLTAGLLLESRAAEVAEVMDEVIVSLDGPPDVHNRIRNVPLAFERLARGIAAVRMLRPAMKFSARCTVQKQNFRGLSETVATARQLALAGISFLALDTSSAAFNREQPWDEARRSEVALEALEVDKLEAEIETLIRDQASEIRAGFIAESPEKLRRILRHFRAALGQCDPVAPRCNAPWVSAVIEADGTVKPCFFQPAIGNIHSAPLIDIVNGNEALRFRERLDIAADPICRRCVCSLNRPVAVLSEVAATD